MPKLGLTMNEGTVSEWRKKVGDPVEKGEILLIVATDKLTFEVEAGESGILSEIIVKQGESAAVSAPLARIGDGRETAPEAQMKHDASAVEKEPAQRDRPGGGIGRSNIDDHEVDDLVAAGESFGDVDAPA